MSVRMEAPGGETLTVPEVGVAPLEALGYQRVDPPKEKPATASGRRKTAGRKKPTTKEV